MNGLRNEYDKTWKMIPKDQRIELWKKCSEVPNVKTPGEQICEAKVFQDNFYKLYECLADKAGNSTVSAQFQKVIEHLKILDINALHEMSGRLLACGPKPEKIPSAIDKGVEKVRKTMGSPTCVEDIEQTIYRDLTQDILLQSDSSRCLESKSCKFIMLD